MSLIKCIRYDLPMAVNSAKFVTLFNSLASNRPLIVHSRSYQLDARWRGRFLNNRTSRAYHMKNQSTKYQSTYHLQKCHKHPIVRLNDRLVFNDFKVRYISQSNKVKHIQGNFRNCILVSTSKDIFENLAIEDWLYRYQDFEHNELILVWYNRPSIVIGRHQNPWQEVNLDECVQSNVSIARRNSGGGTVFHDENNLNICFFASKRNYNRRRNLEFVRNAVKTNFEIDLKINAKEDLVLDKTEEKVSGTASKLAHNKSYHHCTLLIDTNLRHLSRFIRKKSDFIISNATKSVYSPVKNLSAINPDIKIDNVIDALINNYKSIKQATEVRYVDFDERTFPEISELRDQLKDWNWVFGRTPKFKVVRHDSLNGIEYTCEMNILKGLIDKIDLKVANNLSEGVPNILEGKKLIFEDCESCLNDWLKTKNDFQSLYLSKLVLDTIRAIRTFCAP